MTFDLTGLPPTPREVEAFLADESPDAFARVVDRLLASPRYGERRGRHWLDLVRYTDAQIDEVWRYRDWVIAAFNGDMPYDRFIITRSPATWCPQRPERRECRRDRGDDRAGDRPLGRDRRTKRLADIVDDQLDTIGRASSA